MLNLQVLSNRVGAALQSRMNALNNYLVKSNSLSPKSMVESKSNSMMSDPSRRHLEHQFQTLYIKPQISRDRYYNSKTA